MDEYIYIYIYIYICWVLGYVKDSSSLFFSCAAQYWKFINEINKTTKNECRCDWEPVPPYFHHVLRSFNVVLRERERERESFLMVVPWGLICCGEYVRCFYGLLCSCLMSPPCF
jgi:hypothetical protein